MTDVNECARFLGTDLGCQNGATCRNFPGSYRYAILTIAFLLQQIAEPCILFTNNFSEFAADQPRNCKFFFEDELEKDTFFKFNSREVVKKIFHERLIRTI